MKHILATLAMAMLAIAPAKAQTEVESFVPGSTLEGVNYFLPRTALRLVVEAEKTVVRPGEMHKYAFKYLRLNDVPTAETTVWRIKSVRVQPYGVPDTKKAFNIKVKSKTIAPLVSLTRDGILLAINQEAQETMLPAIPADVPAPALANPRDFMNQEMLTATSTAKQAELCAQEIYDIRESRNALTRGEADNMPKDGQQLQLMLAQLDAQSAALEQLFKGTTQTSTHYFTLNVIPTEEKQQIAFRFSQLLGVVDKDDLSGAPVYLSISPVAQLPKAVQDEAVAKKKDKMEKGVYYNVPVREAVKVFDARNTYFEMECPMGQFGTTEVLADVLFNKNVSTRVSFWQENGGVQKLEQ